MPTCVVCLELYGADEDLSHCCDVCGRCGFCEHCSKPENHDCEKEIKNGMEN